MKKILLSLAATAAIVAAAAPAAAPPWRGDPNTARDRGYVGSQLNTSYVDGLEWKINNAAQQRAISRGEQRQLLSELRQIQPIAWRVQTGQASRWERQRLENGVARIESAVNRYARNDRDDRYDRYSRNDGWRR
jgi:hypothetical protein